MGSRMTNRQNHWLATPREARAGANAQLKLYCIPYAGGGGRSFDGWQDALDPAVRMMTVELPGRGRNLAAAPHTSIGAFIEALAAAILADAGGMPFALYGHSMGALIAFELTRFLQWRKLRAPLKLIVSGCRSPRTERSSRLHLLGNDELIEELRQYNGTPPEVLAHHELMELMLPTIRADFAIVETYSYRSGPTLNLPIAVFAGTGDAYVSTIDGWAAETSAASTIHWFEGGHFFFKEQHEAVLGAINQELAPYLSSCPMPNLSNAERE